MLAASAACLTPLHAADTLRIGVYHNPPKLLQEADGQPGGILGDLLQLIANAEGWQLDSVECHWQRCLALLDAGEIDLLPDVAWSKGREARFDFHHTPALHSWSQLYRGEGPTLRSLLDLDGRRLAVVEGSIQQEYLDQLAEGFGIDVTWVGTDSFNESFTSVKEGRADVAVANHFFGDRYAQPAGLIETPIMFLPSRLYFASSQGRHTDTLAAIDRHLQAWKNDSQSPYFAVLRRWQGQQEMAYGIPAWIWWSIAGLLAMLGTALAFNTLLRRRVEQRTNQLKASEERLSTILDSVEACIFIKNRDLRYTYVNRQVCTLFGQPARAILGKRDSDFFDATTAATLEKNDRRVVEDGERIAAEESNSLIEGGPVRTFLSLKLPLKDADGTIRELCGIATDITAYRQIQQENHRLAYYDPLTGLPNRRRLLELLQHAIAAQHHTGQEGGVLMLDLDHFKSTNETLGHAAGDWLLEQVTMRLSTLLDDSQTLARLGGDEFIVLYENISTQRDVAVRQLHLLGKEVIAQFNTAFEYRGKPLLSAASVGAVMLSESDGDAQQLMKIAEIALYDAKACGRAALRFYNPTMQAEINHRVQSEQDLRHAIETSQLALHLQPQVDAEGYCIGMEALLRWPHPERGMIPPAEFIPIAEASGLIIPLGEWVLEAACQRLAEWSTHPSHRDLILAVNVSPSQFRHPEFVTHLIGLLDSYAVVPSRLELEITENLLIDNVETTVAHMGALRRTGIRFSLDDFGTGYASLTYLKRLPLDQLKIDMSFVRELEHSDDDAAIVRTIIALGHSMGLRVIAEGVENDSQRQRLITLGCEFFQGYLFGRPAPAADWQTTLKAHATLPVE
ncbi:diguanylate cyclase [Halomonas sp. 1513]|nr:diguanylate cyclase [Halomonas sp. 1513]